MRLTRGSSFKGYGGIHESIRDGLVTLIRPLLHTSKTEIEAYQQEHGIGYRHDASNDADDYTRNRFRHHVLPAIEKESKTYRQKLGQFSQYMWEANAFISRLAEDFIHHQTKQLNNQVNFSVTEFNQLDTIVKRDVLKRVYDIVTKNGNELSFLQSNQLLKIIESSKPHGMVSLANNINVTKSYDLLEFNHKNENSPSQDVILLDGIGSWSFADHSFTVTKDLPNIIDGICLELWYNNLDLIFPLSVRTRIDGDKIKIGTGTKKIKDLFIDLKVPMTKRDSLPLVVDQSGEVLWIPGIKISTSTKIGDKVLYVVYKRGSSC
jgi:tRNA(Ile)-lysidine synthase